VSMVMATAFWASSTGHNRFDMRILVLLMNCRKKWRGECQDVCSIESTAIVACEGLGRSMKLEQ